MSIEPEIYIIASVHHTGTHFICDQIVPNYSPRHLDHVGEIAGPIEAKMQIRVHCETGFIGFLNYWTSNHKAIVPLRHPMSVAASWKARERGLDLSELANQWQILKENVDPNKPLYVPIDVPDRERWLDAVRDYLYEPIQTEWPVIMSCNKSAELTEPERDSVKEFMSDGFFDRFGYEV